MDRFGCEYEATVMLELIGASPTAAVLVGPQGDVILANSLARKIFSKGDTLRIHRGQLGSDASLELVKKLIESALLERGAAVAVLPRKRSERPLLLRAMLLKAKVATTPVIAVLIVDLDEMPSADQALIQQFFRLTPTESSLVCSLVSGQSVGHAAETMGITVNTVRSHLKKIFKKLRLTSQAELINLILRSPVYAEMQRFPAVAEVSRGKET
jgi:DNA-binding CsgD family transcriptional regulator